MNSNSAKIIQTMLYAADCEIFRRKWNEVAKICFYSVHKVVNHKGRYVNNLAVPHRFSNLTPKG